MTLSTRRWPVGIAVALLMLGGQAHAGCDNIPTEIDEFRATQGAITAPFAIPGQLLQVRVRPQACDATSLGLGTAPACVASAAVRVTLIFVPGAGAPANAVVLARDCGDPGTPGSLAARVAAWASALAPGGTAVCLAQPQLDVVAASVGLVSECRLNFQFPTATGPALVLPNTLTGPTRIVVEPVDNPLPTDLVAKRCADVVAAADTVACIDELYRVDGTCFTETENVNIRFPGFTALPVPNDFAAMAGAEPPALRFALDTGGNVLAPMDWSGVLCEADADCTVEGFPPPKLVEVLFPRSFGSGLDGAGAPAVPGSALVVPNAELTASLTIQGTELPPIFDPSATAPAPGTETLSLFGSTDAVKTVIRLQTTAPGRCTLDDVPCVSDAGCSTAAGAQTCDLSATDLRLADLAYCRHPGACQAPGTGGAAPAPSGGPAVIPSALYHATTDGFVLLETLNACRDSDQLTCLLRDEGVAGIDKNDGDLLDPSVLTLRDKLTGAKLPVGLDGQSEGLATALLHEPPAPVGPFGAPVVDAPVRPSVRPTATAAGGCAALLFAEPWENRASIVGVDANQDGEVFDPVLRVFCRNPGAPGGVEEVAEDAAAAAGLGTGLGASAAPLILASPRTVSPLQGGGEPLVVADGRLYVLLDEAANATRAPDVRVDVDSSGVPADRSASDVAISAGGRVLCFASDADLVASRDKNQDGADIYCRDLGTGQTEVVNRFQEKPRRGPLCAGRVIRANQAAAQPSVSDEGRRVCYDSAATNLLPGGVDKNKTGDVFVYERVTCETVRVSLTATGAESTLPSGECDMAATGTRVAFTSAGRLVAADGDALSDVYVTPLLGGTDASRDPLRAGVPVLASAGLPGDAGAPSLSADGLRVAFEYTTASGTRVVVRDLGTGAPVDPLGFDLAGTHPRLSGDGRVLMLEVVSDDTGLPEAFAIDLAVSARRGAVVGGPVAQTVNLEDVMAESFEASASDAAVAFATPEALTPDDVPGAGQDVHVRDLTTRLMKRVGTGAGTPALSRDGTSVGYLAPVGPITAVFRHGPVLGAGADIDGNGSARDRVLAALDLASSTPQLAVIGAARQAAVAGPNAAWIAPDGRLLVRTCAANRSCSVKTLRAPGSPSPALATAVAVSGPAVCALLQGTGRLACAPVGASQLIDLGVVASGLGMTGDFAVVTTAAVPAQLRAFRLQGGGFVAAFTGGPGTRRFVLAENGFAAFDRCEADVGSDLNGDGLEDECVMNLVDLDTGLLLETFATVLPCTLEACDRRFPWRVFPSGALGESATVRFLTLECQEDGSCAGCDGGCAPAGRQCDLNLNGSCADVIVREIASNDRQFVLAGLFGDVNAIKADPLAGIASGGTFNQGAVFPALVGRCDVDFDPTTEPTTQPCQSDGNCPAGLVCGPPFSVLALNDGDGDGIFDGFDNCPDTFNPEQGDGDGDRAGDACDLFTCGDGVVDAREFCDDGARNGACAGLELDACVALGAAGSFCDDLCRPEVFLDVSESAVNPDKAGALPMRVYGTPYLNFGPARDFDGTTCAIPGGCPAEMIDLASVRLEGVATGATCTGAGAPLDGINVGDVNSDGIPDLQTKVQVADASIALSDDQACLTGDFRRVEGRFRTASFEARDHLNVK